MSNRSTAIGLLMTLTLMAWAAPGRAEVGELAGPMIVAEEVLPEPVFPQLDPLEPQVEFDPYMQDHERVFGTWPEQYPPIDGYGRSWTWQFLPDGQLYRSYLAGAKEPRFSGIWFHEKDQGWLWDVTLGGRVGVLRYGSRNSFRPEGWQVDIEGAAFPRLDLEDERDVISTDFRFGVPVTYAIGMFETKLAYYHLSSHLGDEFIVKNPGRPRINYSRDVVVLGSAMYLTDALRLYAEAGYAFYNSGGSQPWELQFGADFSPPLPTTLHGAPFAAVNAHLRQEVDFGGNLTAQIGWQWRGCGSRRLLRAGLHYLVGKSPQFQFFNTSEEQWGFGLWYDY